MVWVVPIERIRPIAGVESIGEIERMIRIKPLGRVKRIIRTILMSRVEEVVVALVLLVEPGFCSRGTSGEEETEEPDYAQGKPCRPPAFPISAFSTPPMSKAIPLR